MVHRPAFVAFEFHVSERIAVGLLRFAPIPVKKGLWDWIAIALGAPTPFVPGKTLGSPIFAVFVALGNVLLS